MRTVAGLQHATQGNAFTRVATRGLRDTRDVLVLLDGAPFRQLSGSADLTMIPVSMLQGVEFVKGGASSVYGRGAVGGVMQFFTVPQASREPSVEAVYGFGSFSTHEGQATVNVPYTGGRFAATASASRSDGHQRDTGRDTNFLSFVNDYALTDQSNLRMHYLVSDVDAGRGSIVPLENGRPMFGITREDNFGIPDARFEGRLHSATGKADVAPNSNFLVTNSFNFNRYERFSTGGITIVPPPTTRTKGWFQGDSTQDTWLNDTMVQWDAGTAQVQNTFMAGLGFEWGDQQQVSPSFSSGATFLGPDYVNPVRNAANGPKGIERPGSISDFQQSIVSLYAQDRIQAGRVAGPQGSAGSIRSGTAAFEYRRGIQLHGLEGQPARRRHGESDGESSRNRGRVRQRDLWIPAAVSESEHEQRCRDCPVAQAGSHTQHRKRCQIAAP